MTSAHFLLGGLHSPNVNVPAVLAVIAVGLAMILIGWLRRR
jgi:hypothetical protein